MREKSSSPHLLAHSVHPLMMLGGLGLLFLCAFLPGFGPDVKFHWASSALLAFAGCILAARLPPPWILPGLLLWFSGLGTVTLLALWHSGLSDGFTLAGLFPYSDAAGYMSDAQRILAGEPITAFSSRRPLYAASLAALLKLTGNHLRLTLWLQTILVACSLGWVTWGVLVRTRRVGSAAVFGMALWLFFRRFIGTTTTENLGLMLGALGFLAIWEALHDHSSHLFTLGLFLTGLALNARAGAFFVLPALLIWGGVCFAKGGQRVSWRALGMGGVALVLSFVVNYGVLVLSGGRPELAFSNFSYTLYGLVHGGNWQLALAQHPELRTIDPGSQASAVFQFAMEQIRTHPLNLLAGACRAWVGFLPRVFLFADAPHPWAPTALASLFLTLLAMRGAFAIWGARSTPASGLMMTYLAGILLSVPFAPPWDSDYMRIYAGTIPALCWLASEGVLPGIELAVGTSRSVCSPRFWGILGVTGCFLLAIAVPHFRRSSDGENGLKAIPGSVVRISSAVPSPDSPNPSPRPGRLGSWAVLLREGKLPPLTLDQIRANALPGIAPEEARAFLAALPPGEVTLVLVMGESWPLLAGTNLVAIHNSSAWVLSARGADALDLAVPLPLP